MYLKFKSEKRYVFQRPQADLTGSKRMVEWSDEIRPCVRTWTALAILPTTLPKGVAVYGAFALMMILDFYLVF